MDTSKIIKGVVSNGRYTVTAPIVKEDYGLYLQIEGVELPSTYEVDFSNSENNGTSVTMIGNADGVLIPRQFIDSGKDVFAFLYHVGEDFGRTVYKFRIPNKVRPDRTEEQPTPEEQSTIDQAISALNTAVAQTAQDKADADVSAQNASADADRAEEASTDAQNYATQAEQAMDDAQTYANNASASATASAQSASQSAQIKADVEDLADDAQGYAQASERSATASANSASQAQGYAQSASASAQSASQYASSAQTSANTASAKAQDASGYAQAASQKATESAQSASQALTYKTDAESAKTASQTAQGLAEQARNEAVSAKNDAESARDDAESARDEAVSAVATIGNVLADKADVITDTASGSIASFSDGADDLPLKSLVVDINPVQDLHGQDAPYPAGAINIWDEEWVSNGSRIESKNLIPVLPNTTYAWVSPTPPANGLRFYDANKTLLSTMYSVSGGVFITPSDCYYIWFALGSAYGTTYNHDVSINYPSTITTYHPYENICPISGWTQVGVEQSGVNVWDEEWELGIYNSINGEPNDSTSNIRCKNPIPVIPSTRYYVNRNGYNLRVVYYDANENFISSESSLTVTTITTPSSCHFIKFYLGTAYGTTYNHDISINYPSADHSYHPYTGRSIAIQLGQTVYGGKLDVLSGELVIDRAMVDLGTLTWNRNESLNLFFTNISNAKYVASSKGTPCKCSALASARDMTWSGWSNFPDYAIAVGNNFATGSYNTTVKMSNYDSPDAFKTAMSGVQLCYELATPIEIQLTPNQVNSLLGVNNIWADTGDTTAEYRADTKLYIQKKIAEAISALS